MRGGTRESLLDGEDASQQQQQQSCSTLTLDLEPKCKKKISKKNSFIIGTKVFTYISCCLLTSFATGNVYIDDE